jgi:hypothetical protein
MAPHADADSQAPPPQDIPLNTPSCPFKEQGSLYLLGYGPLSAMTYLSNKDYLR